MTTPSTPLLTVDTLSPVPPYEQIRSQLAELINHAVLVPGQRLPPVRQLAVDLGLAPGTVARAYHELETAGLVLTRRGGGTVVGDVPAVARGERGQSLTAQAASYVAAARRLGATDPEIVAAVQGALGTP